MDLTGKLKMQSLSRTDIETMCVQLSLAETQIKESFKRLADSVSYQQMRLLVEEKYQLGQLVDVYEIFGGYVNRSFGAIVKKDGCTKDYFIRKYKRGVTEEDIRVEHGLIQHAVAHGMDTLSYVYSAPDGDTYYCMDEFIDGQAVSRYFAVYQFLEGEDRYSWINTNMNREEDISYGELLASFHACTMGFDPGEKAEPPIISLMEIFRRQFPGKVAQLPSSDRFRLLWEKRLEDVLENCRIAREYFLRPGVSENMPTCPCHCDFHPGNVKWIDNRCASVFDLDWSKLDKRLYDLSLAILYACSSWESADNGAMNFERVENILRGYDGYLQRKEGIIRFTETECEAFPYMMLSAALYLVNWCSSYCSGYGELNEFEYFFYLSHCFSAMDRIVTEMDKYTEIMRRVRYE